MGSQRLPASEEDHAAAEAALARLEAPDRAVLELAIRHRRSDSEIAAVTGVNELAIEALRSEALRVIADDLGLQGEDARSDAALRLESVFGREDSEDSKPVARTVEIGEEVSRADHVPPARKRGEARRAEAGRRRVGAALLLVALLVGTALFAIVLSGGSDDPAESQEVSLDDEATPPEPQPVPDPNGGGGGREGAGAVELDSLTGSRGTVSVSQIGNPDSGRLRIELDGLPPAGRLYRAWLYNSVIGSIPLGSPVDGSGSIEAPIPGDASAFEFLDVSLQARGDRAHSGQSVFRVPLERVLPPAG